MKTNNSETSLEVYAKEKSSLTRQKQTAFELLQKNLGSTANELALFVEDSFPKHHRHNMQARLADLRDDGWVDNPPGEAGKRKCRVTKRIVQTWVVVPEFQREEFRKKVLVKKIFNLKMSVARAQTKLAKLIRQSVQEAQ